MGRRAIRDAAAGFAALGAITAVGGSIGCFADAFVADKSGL